MFIMSPAPGAFWNCAIRLSVCPMAQLGSRHAGCLQLCHRRPPEMCGLRTSPRTDVDPPRLLDRTAIGGAHIVSPHPGRYLTVRRMTVRRLDTEPATPATLSLLPSLELPAERRFLCSSTGKVLLLLLLLLFFLSPPAQSRRQKN